MFPFLSSSGLSAADAARLRRVEAKLDRILTHFGIKSDDIGVPKLSTEVRELADNGQKIQAIKAYREETNANLRDAKDAVEAYMASNS